METSPENSPQNNEGQPHAIPSKEDIDKELQDFQQYARKVQDKLDDLHLKFQKLTENVKENSITLARKTEELEALRSPKLMELYLIASKREGTISYSKEGTQ